MTKTRTPSPVRLILATPGTPLGQMLLVVDEAGRVRGLDFADAAPRLERLLARAYPGLPLQPGRAPACVSRALDAYFGGEIDALAGLETATAGTAFQERVWAALRDIPAGITRSYLDIAASLDSPNACRAVGMANGANPVSLIIPCHRVIGRSGALTGYAGGMERKAWLLAHEGVDPRPADARVRHSSAVISQ